MDAADIQAVYYALQQKLNVGWAVNQLIAVCLPLALFFTGWGSRAYDFLRAHLRAWAAAAFAFFFSIALATSITQFAIVHQLLTLKSEVDGSGVPGFPAFLAAKLPEAVMASSLMGVAGILLCYILERRRRLTWLWLSVLTTALVSMALMAAPSFTGTQPLGDTSVERAIAAMADRVGIPVDRIAKERCANPGCPPGRVIGLGPTRLMLLDDRLTGRTPEDQLLQVFAHEAKHYLLDNNSRPVALIFIVCVALFLATQTLSSALSRRPHDPSRAEQAKGVPLVYGLGLAAFILLQPAINTYRQHVEFEADRFGLEFNRDNQALIDIMRTDAAANPMLVRYTPITRYFRATHPEIQARIQFAEAYRPWLDNQRLVYARYFAE
jgi:STE24 endopeptidase